MSRGGRPNVVVLMADDHRGTELGHLPGAQARTPNIDSLARRGVSFTQAHCQGSMIKAVCVPSRASLMTGRNIFASSMDPGGCSFQESLTIPPDLETFPEAARKSGYNTYAVGKWHNDTAAFNRSFAGGDALMFIGMSDHYRVPVRAYNPEGTYPGANSHGFDDTSQPDVETYNRTGDPNDFSTNIFANAAIEFIEGYDSDDPFLMYVAFTAPHDPRTPPPGWTVDPDDVDLPPNYMPEHPFDNGEMAVRDELLAAFPRNEGEIRQHLADYHGMIAHLDDAVGRILAALDERKLTENTVVIYTGDHGLSVGQHGLMGKQSLYEHSLRVPLVIAGPGVPEGVVSDGLVWHADTNATIRALCGMGQAPGAEGKTLIDDGRVSTPRRQLGAAYEYGQRMFRNDRYKLIRYRPIPDTAPKPGTSSGSHMIQLFDLANDPWELNNLADDPAHRAVREQLEQGMRAWQVEVGDELLRLASPGS